MNRIEVPLPLRPDEKDLFDLLLTRAKRNPQGRGCLTLSRMSLADADGNRREVAAVMADAYDATGKRLGARPLAILLTDPDLLNGLRTMWGDAPVEVAPESAVEPY